MNSIQRQALYLSFMRHLFLSLLCCVSLLEIQAQKKNSSNFFRLSDTIQPQRLRTVCAGQGIIWAGSLLALNQAWYAGYDRSSFHLFNDLGEWQQVDKAGHAYSAYWGAQLSSGLFRWAGVPRKKAALYGAGMGVAYESVIEILDGFSSEWGFSLGDMGANISGSALFAAQEYAWEEQRIQFKFSAHRVDYHTVELLKRANQKYGASNPERWLKDYNGQTYWLSLNLWSFAKKSKLPRWLNLAVGYGADGMLGGYSNQWTDAETGIVHDRNDIPRIRQFYLSPDIDLSKIRIRGKTPAIFSLLNSVKLKFPLPTLEFNTAGRVTLHAFYF